MAIVVRPLAAVSSASWTTRSDVLSKAEVASSRRLECVSGSIDEESKGWKKGRRAGVTYRILGSPINARAMATLCF